jgi:predicted Rossmann fold nucleotide-binding protein DprA/Smf involved in DNA uptake
VIWNDERRGNREESPDKVLVIDDLVERSGLNSSEVLATLFTLERKGIVRQLPGKQFCKVLL